MPSEFRVKESCLPCKKRKSKCDAQQPCASCILRGTGGRCEYTSGPPPSSGNGPGPSRRPMTDNRASPYPRQNDLPEPTAASTKRAMGEIAKLKSSIHHLEGHVRDLAHLDNALVVDDEPATPQEQENWRRLQASLPNRAVVEVLVEYLIQECDWLWSSGDILTYWQRAVRTGGVSSSTAGLLAMSMALPAHMLGRLQGPLYRLPLDTATFHPAMFELSRSFAVPNLTTLADFEHFSAMILYQVYAGRHDNHLSSDCYVALKAATEQGWLDENQPIWQNLDDATRERARRVIGYLHSNYTWTKMYDPSPSLLDGNRVNLCAPSPSHPFLKAPIELGLNGEAELVFRVFRTVSRSEQAKSAEFHRLMREVDIMVTEIRRYHIKVFNNDIENGRERHNLVTLCQSLYDSLFDLRERKAPRLGFSDSNLADLDLSDPASARLLAMILVIHNAIGFLMSSITRPWLVEEARTPAEQALHDACLEAATRAMSLMDVTRALVATRNAPFVPAFSSGNLFNSATAFTIPVLRAVKLWTADNRDKDIQDLKTIPNLHDRNSAAPDAGIPRTLPSTIYIDGAIRTYANNILLILDTLKALNLSPLAQEAERRLSMLIQKFGLRDSQEYDIPFQPDMAWNGNITWTTPPEAEQPMDPAVFNQLLLLDNSIWQGLMDPRNHL